MNWLKETLREEAITVFGLVVVGGLFFITAFFGDLFGGIGDKLFGKKDQP